MIRALLAVVAALVLTGDAQACVCADVPLAKRLDDVDAAVVGRVHGFRVGDDAQPSRLMTFDVEQRVKGDVERQVEGVAPRRILVQVPSGTDCDVSLKQGETTGLLLTKLPTGNWYATACSVVNPGALVAAGGEPRGGAIKVAIGAVILAIVLVWALVRLRRGTRPKLPGAAAP